MLVKDSIRGPEFDATAHTEREEREHYNKTERDAARCKEEGERGGGSVAGKRERARE